MTTVNKLLKSSGLLVVIRLLQRSLGLISTLVLARLLTPEDFGVVAVASLIVFFAEVISNTGLQQYIVKTKLIDDDVISSAWTFNLLIKAGLVIFLYCLSPFVENLYDDEDIYKAIVVLLPVIFVRALQNPQLHVFRRDLDYMVVFKVDVIAKFVSFSAVLTVAYFERSFWAIVVGDIVSVIAALVLSYIFCSYRPRLILTNVKEQWDFSKWMMARGCVGYLKSQIDVLMVSQFYSIRQLGFFNLAREISVLPTNEIIRPAVEPLLASFARIQDEGERLRFQFNMAQLVIASVVSPILAFIFFYHDSLVLVVLGEKWEESGNILLALTPLIFSFSLSAVTNALCIAKDKIKSVFIFDAITLICVIGVMVSLRSVEIDSFIFARSGASLIFTMIFLGYCQKIISGSFWRGGAFMAIPLSISFILGWVFFYMLGIDSFYSLMAIGVLYVVSFGVLLLLVITILKVRGGEIYAFHEYIFTLIRKLKG